MRGLDEVMQAPTDPAHPGQRSNTLARLEVPFAPGRPLFPSLSPSCVLGPFWDTQSGWVSVCRLMPLPVSHGR